MLPVIRYVRGAQRQRVTGAFSAALSAYSLIRYKRRIGSRIAPAGGHGLGVRKWDSLRGWSWRGAGATLFFLLARWLSLHILPAEAPFDAKIAVSYAVVER